MALPIFSKKTGDCKEFVANDGCHIRELIHPKNDPVSLPYSLAVATLAAGKSTYRHYLKQTELYYILNGQGCLHVDDSSRNMTSGDAAMVPPEMEQWLENTGEGVLEFIAIVSPPWCLEDDIPT